MTALDTTYPTPFGQDTSVLPEFFFPAPEHAQVLASYTYGSANNHLSSMTYGNGDTESAVSPKIYSDIR